MSKDLLTSKTPKVYKNKKLNNANFGDYNLNEYQVFLQLITKIGKIDELGKYQQSTMLPREYTLTAKEFSLQFQIDITNAYQILKRSTKKLSRTAITLEQPDLFETWEIPVCNMAKYNHKEGSMTIEFNCKIMPYLTQVGRHFMLYNLKEIANFGSIYTTRLYELIQEFKDTGWILKSIQQLRAIFAVGEKFTDYYDFKRFTFLHAVNEINSQFDMKLSFEEIKDGRKVVAIKFSFIPTFIIRGVDKTGNPKNVYIKPKRKKVIETEKPKEDLTQADLPF